MKNGTVEEILFLDKADIDKSVCTICCEDKHVGVPFQQSSSNAEDVLISEVKWKMDLLEDPNITFCFVNNSVGCLFFF